MLTVVLGESASPWERGLRSGLYTVDLIRSNAYRNSSLQSPTGYTVIRWAPQLASVRVVDDRVGYEVEPLKFSPRWLATVAILRIEARMANLY